MSKEKDIDIFTTNIRRIREKEKLTKGKMAKTLGISVKSLNMIEKGALPSRLSAKVLFKVRDMFNISVYELLSDYLKL